MASVETTMNALKKFGINSKEELFEAMKQGKGDLDIGLFINPIPGRHNEKVGRGNHAGGDDESARAGV